MEFARGVRYHFIPSKKYKTNQIKVRFASEINANRVGNRILVASMLGLANQMYPSSQEFREHLANMYGTEFSTNIFRRGLIHYVDIDVSFVRDDFLSKKNTLTSEAIRILRGSLYAPLAEDGSFEQSAFQIEKRNLLLEIKSQMEDPYFESHSALNHLFFEDDRMAIPKLGTESIIEQVTPHSAYEELSRMLVEDQIDIFFMGDFNQLEVEEHLSKFSFKDRDVDLQLTYQQEFTNVVSDNVSQRDINQSILEIGYHFPTQYGDEMHLPLILVNSLLGGFANSKLFVNVREKEGLAYTISSSMDIFSGFLRMYAGIDASNRMRAFTIMNRQLSDIKRGKFTEKDLQECKRMVKNTTLLSMDRQQTIIERNYFQTILKHRFLPLEDWLEKIENITKEDIIRAAKEVQLQSIFFLEGKR